MYNLVVFSTSTVLASYHLYQVPGHFHHPKGNPVPILPYTQPLATTNLLPVSVNLPILDIPYKWNHRLYEL